MFRSWLKIRLEGLVHRTISSKAGMPGTYYKSVDLIVHDLKILTLEASVKVNRFKK